MVCHCSRHKPGCGCLSDNFIERARNNFSLILSRTESAKEFAARIKALARHARDEHEWDGGRCDFLEASHNVFIRFRPKHIYLVRLHYVVSTELALLQSNMTYMYEKRGPQYHWVVELFRRLELPVFDGVYAALEAFNRRRKIRLDYQKTDKYKQRRIELKVERTLDAQRRKDWSKKHGHDTYGSGDSDEDDGELKSNVQKKRKQGQISTGGKCKSCGSTSHLRSNHSECPFNKQNMKSGVSDEDRASENSDVIHYSGDAMSNSENSSCVSRVSSPDCHSEWCFEDDIICVDICTCGAHSQAHNKICPLSSRNRYIRCTLFPKASSVDSQANTDRCGKSKLPKTSKVSTGSTQLGKKGQPAKSLPQRKRVHLTSVWVTVWVCMKASWASTMSLAVSCKCLVIDAYCVVTGEFSQLVT